MVRGLPGLSAAEVIRALNLRPLPIEGGFYAETYRSAVDLPGAAGVGCDGPRSLATAIYYFLTPDTFSAMHRLRGDEVYHFYLGDPVELVLLRPDLAGETIVLGPDIVGGMRVQHVVPGGVWQGARLAPGGAFALLGTTMAPGFDAADFALGERAELSKHFPLFAAKIAALTR